MSGNDDITTTQCQACELAVSKFKEALDLPVYRDSNGVAHQSRVKDIELAKCNML